MLIKLPDIHNPVFNEVHVGQRKRLATASGCTFLSEDTLAILNLASQRIYLVKIQKQDDRVELVDSISTTFDGELCASDLITSRNNIIAASNFDRSLSLYKVRDGKLSTFREFAFSDLGYCHGIKFYTDDIVCFTSMQLLDRICFFDIRKNSMLFTMDFQVPGPRDICFLSHDRMVVIYTTRPPSPHKPYNFTDSKVHLVEFDLPRKKANLLAEFTIPRSQIDGCDNIGNLVYITCAQENMDTVYILNTENNNLSFSGLIEGFHIPHGLATCNRLLAVTNYLDNTVRVIDTLNSPRGVPVLTDDCAVTFDFYPEERKITSN